MEIVIKVDGKMLGDANFALATSIIEIQETSEQALYSFSKYN